MSIDRWMDKEVVYIHLSIYIMEYSSAIKKEWNNAIYSNMDGPRDYHTKWSQRKTNIIWHHLYVEFKKNDTNELIYKTETDSQI